MFYMVILKRKKCFPLNSFIVMHYLSTQIYPMKVDGVMNLAVEGKYIYTMT